MTRACRAVSCALTVAAAFSCASASAAHGLSPGGVLAPSAADASPGVRQVSSPALAGGSEYGIAVGATAAQRPVVGLWSVPSTAVAGTAPRVSLRIDEPGVATVAVRVTVTDLSTRRPVIVLPLGWVATGRALVVRWPAGWSLGAGSYHVSLAAHDRRWGTLVRRAHSSGVATLVVSAPAPVQSPAPPSSASSPELGVPTPAQSAAEGAVFPVAGAHSFGGPENRFGAPRGNHVHQGQDILTAEGTPIVAPLAGTIVTTSYQAGGAGYYVVEHTGVGLDFMFAHCTSGSVAVRSAESVSAGQQLCQAGQTGDANTPHLHFEVWVGGWQASGGHPLDPLPYLESWERRG